MKILIIRLSSIGDIVLTSPVVRCVKQQLPGAEVHYLTKPVNVPILQANPYVDKVIVYEQGLRNVLRVIRDEHYDYIVDLHNNRRSRWIRLLTAVRSSTFSKENFHKIVYIASHRNVMSGRHVVDRYFDAVRQLGMTNDGGGLDYFCPDEPLPAVLAAGDAPYVVLVVGSKHYTKTIPPERIAYLANHISGRKVLIGDQNDRQRLESAGVTLNSDVVNLCGKTTLGQSANIIKRAALVVTPDTGMMHIAAAFHKRMVVIWGCTAAPFGFTPYKTEFVDFAVDLPCRPCSRMGFDKCPKGHFKCMVDQPWKRILDVINQQMEKES
ncbi:MAG: glycosyltransferase family 9 protein [Bacteroidales bacterium]|nr:glycosyltransferase family 9 protein [Bacteroidales bacterium]